MLQMPSFQIMTNKSFLCSCMAQEISIHEDLSKEEKYSSLLPQIKALISGEDDLVANLANITAALKETFGWLWIGFYLVKQDELVLGPFQGPVACTRIAFGMGVCGACWKQNETIVVDDVDAFEGHIACSSASKSEIVVPLLKNGFVIGVLDIDSENLKQFDLTDKNYLEKLSLLITPLFTDI